MPKNCTHGLSYDPLYMVWAHMLARCNNNKNAAYPNYGGRGIAVCAAWHSLQTFIDWANSSGYSTGLTLDRVDNDQGYSPANCRWTTRTTQQRNRRSHKGSSSTYIGVCFFKLTGKWKAYVKVNKVLIYLGYYHTELEAAKARDQYIVDNNLQDFTMNGVL